MHHLLVSSAEVEAKRVRRRFSNLANPNLMSSEPLLLDRRSLLTLGAVLAAFRLLPGTALAQDGWGPQKLGDPQPFGTELVRQRAKALAAEAWAPSGADLETDILDLSYDQYRDIRFRPEAAVWRGSGLPFEVQLFHLGSIFRTPVTVNLVQGEESRRLEFDPAMFTYGPLVPEPAKQAPLPGFAGFRVHAPINRADYLDEFVVFQGASYFRSLGAGQNYGLSARGLAIATAEPTGEEFPEFREFWIERPEGQVEVIVIHAVLDSPSTTGAFRFTIRPGGSTVMDVEAVLYPREEIDTVGLAPLTSMFWFSPQDREGIDDFREAVHDSDGLLLWNGSGELIWRPLLNPQTLQMSLFMDRHPRGFGLVQRSRDFRDFQDLEARYERRPSLWVEPVGDWGDGSVLLIEIPSDSEANDNIVAFWRPRALLKPGTEHHFAYRLNWGGEPPPVQPGPARVVATRVGLAGAGADMDEITRRIFVIDFSADKLAELAAAGAISVAVRNSAGKISDPVIVTDPAVNGARVYIELEPSGEPVVELDCTLMQDGKPVSEKWVYRWLA